MTPVSELLKAQRDNVRTVARSFGVPESKIVIAPRQGQVNLTVFLGDELVLRLPRKPAFAERLAKEAAVIPFVRERGIPTACVVRFDPDPAIADVAYIVLERLHGRTSTTCPSPPTRRSERTAH